MKQQLETQHAKTTTLRGATKKQQAAYDDAQDGAALVRHGDLMFVKASLQGDATPIQTRELLRSTVTGHVHGIEGDAVIYTGRPQRATGSGHYVVVTGPARAGMHLEHKPAVLPVGTYEVCRKREQHEDYSAAVMD